MELCFRLLEENARLPEQAHEGDAGIDLRCLEGFRLGPGERIRARTGLAVEIPPGHAGLVLPRSGLADRYGIALVNAPGLIDSGYRGELQVLLLNTDPSLTFVAESGDRIAQLMVAPFAPVVPVAVEELSGSGRAEGGFGSTGV